MTCDEAMKLAEVVLCSVIDEIRAKATVGTSLEATSCIECINLDKIVDHFMSQQDDAAKEIVPESRWYEIATEGLPQIDPPPVGSTRVAFWTFDSVGRQRILNFYVASDGTPAIAPFWEAGGEGGATVTYWYPIELPSPPTKEPR